MNQDKTNHLRKRQKEITRFLCERTLANIVAGGRPRAESLLDKIEHSAIIVDGKLYGLYISAFFDAPKENDVIRVSVSCDSCSSDELCLGDVIPNDLEPVDQSKQVGLQEDLFPEGLPTFPNRGLEKNQLDARLGQLEEAMESLLGERVICIVGRTFANRERQMFLRRWRIETKTRLDNNLLNDAKTMESHLPVKVWMLEEAPPKFGREVSVKFVVEILDRAAIGKIKKDFFETFMDFGVFSKENGAAALTAIVDAYRLPYTAPDYLETLVGASVLEKIDPGYFAYRIESGFLPDMPRDMATARSNGYLEFSSYGPNAPPALVDIAQGRIPAGLQ